MGSENLTTVKESGHYDAQTFNFNQLSAASDFLAAFYPDRQEAVHLRSFKPKGAPDTATNRPSTYTTTRGELTSSASLRHRLETDNAERGIYFVVNAGGNTDKDISRYNAFFVENDTRSMEEQHAALNAAPIAASIRNETRKSVHAFWLIEGDCNENEWRDVQERLIAYFDGDRNIKNPSRTMRLPYFNHVTYDAENGYSYKPVEVITFEPLRRYTVDEMKAAFPAPKKAQPLIFDDFSSTSSLSPEWVELNAELKRRISQFGRMNSRGIIETKGICHNGKSKTAIMFNPATGAVKCMNGCTHGQVLRAFGLPEKPINSLISLLSRRLGEGESAEKSDFPNLSGKALYGLAGEIVRTIATESEAHPAALLSQLLVTFGNVIGFDPHFRTEADKQGTNLFAVIVGKSARAGRKGTSWGYIERLFTDAASDWKASNLQHGGLSSGEGLIKRLRDDGTFALGFQDKRLLVVEGEFSSVMRVKNREGNILQDVLRNAWDRKPLCVLRRDEPEKATDPHLSFIGHITSDELNMVLKDVDFHNGYFNRIQLCL